MGLHTGVSRSIIWLITDHSGGRGDGTQHTPHLTNTDTEKLTSPAKQQAVSSPASCPWCSHSAPCFIMYINIYKDNGCVCVFIYSPLSLGWANINGVIYKCQEAYSTAQNLQTINLSWSHLWWYLNKMTRLATSIPADLYLFGLFLVFFKGYGITARAENYVVHFKWHIV